MAQSNIDVSGIALGQPGIPQPIADALLALQTAVNSIDSTQIGTPIFATKLDIDQVYSFAAGNTLKPRLIGALAYRTSGDQTGVLPSTDTQVVLDAETYDTGNNYDPASSRSFLVSVAGYYLIKGCVQYTVSEDNKLYRARVWNGAGLVAETFAPGVRLAGPADSLVSVYVATTRHLAVGANLFLSAFHNQAGNATVKGGNDLKTFLEVTLIAKD